MFRFTQHDKAIVSYVYDSVVNKWIPARAGMTKSIIFENLR